MVMTVPALHNNEVTSEKIIYSNPLNPYIFTLPFNDEEHLEDAQLRIEKTPQINKDEIVYWKNPFDDSLNISLFLPHLNRAVTLNVVGFKDFTNATEIMKLKYSGSLASKNDENQLSTRLNDLLLKTRVFLKEAKINISEIELTCENPEAQNIFDRKTVYKVTA